MLDDNPTLATVNSEWEKLRQIIKRGGEHEPPKKYLLVCLWAGHGMVKSGKQVLLTNELDKRSKFYKMIQAESMMRAIASLYDNVYIVSLFACCR